MTASLIETQADLTKALEARGWTVSFDETRMPSAEFRDADRVLHALLTKRGTRFPFDLGGWITIDALSIAYTVLGSPRKRFADSCPLVLSPMIRIEKPVADDADIDAAVERWIEWARHVDIDRAIEALLDKDANPSGDMPARHLAALAATGAVEVLEHYSQSFASGDRLGFVPYVTADHIESALAFAQHRNKDPKWLPRTPKMRV